MSEPIIAPVVAPVAAPVAPAPVVAAPVTLNDFAEIARKSIAGETAAPASAPVVAGQEPSPAAPEIAPAEPVTEPVLEAVTGDEPTAEEKAAWTAGETKLHGALVKERLANKEARAETRELRAKQAELESKINALSAPKAEPSAPVAQAPTTPSVGSGALADCPTFEAVDARVIQAATTESEAWRLQNMLNRNGLEPVADRLKKMGVETISGTPIAEASADQVGEFLASVYEGARTTQAQAVPRKTWLAANHQSLADAVEILPELRDVNSAAFKAVQAMVQANPLLRNRADWPVVAAKQHLGQKAWNEITKPKAAPAVVAPVAARPAVKAAPGAPRTSVSALPQTNGNDALAKKMAAGTATLAEVQEYTRGKIVA